MGCWAGRAGAEVLTGSPKTCHWPSVCPFSLNGPLGFPSTAPSCAQALVAPPRLPQPRAHLHLATSMHLRCLSSLCCSIYLNGSLILHPPPQDGIKFTENQEMQSRAKLVITIKPREKQNRDTQFDFLSLPFFLGCPFPPNHLPPPHLFYCCSSLLPVSTTSFHQGPHQGFFPACFLCCIY